MIVLDASTALEALLHDGASRQVTAKEAMSAPYLVDSQVMSGLAKRHRAGRLDEDGARAAIHTWRRAGIARHSTVGLLDRVWELRHDVTPYDAAYVALAERLRCALVTVDARLSRASGVRCPVTVLPR